MMADDAPKNDDAGKKGKKQSGIDKYKWWIVGGGGMILVIVFLAVRSSNSSANTAAATQASSTGIDPLTGLPSGSPADLAALSMLDNSEGYNGNPGESSSTGSSTGTTGTGTTTTTGSGTGTTVTQYPNPLPPTVGTGATQWGSSGDNGLSNTMWNGQPLSSQQSYTAQSGDTLSSIAAKTGSSAGAIRAANVGVLPSSGVPHPGMSIQTPKVG